MAQLKPLASIIPPDLLKFDRADLISDIVTRIKSDPTWNSQWDGELSHNAAYSIINYFAYLFEKNAQVSNYIVKENFLASSVSETSILENLKAQNINLKQNKESITTLRCTLADPNDFFQEVFTIPAFTFVDGIGTDGSKVFFEFTTKNDGGRFNYLQPVSVARTLSTFDSFDIEVYSGKSFTDSVDISDQIDNFSIDVGFQDIIEDSIEVYYNYGTPQQTKLIETKTFVSQTVYSNIAVFPNGTPQYILRYDQNGAVNILFGNKDFGSDFNISATTKNLTIFGRAGGGAITNIAPNNINGTFLIGGKNLIVTNITAAAGGVSREDISLAKTYAPYKYGRDKAIVTDTDLVNRMPLDLVNKYRIDSPRFVSGVKMLHAYHYIAPDRNSASFQVPQVSITNIYNPVTLEGYNTTFLQSINDFFNIQGANSAPVIELFSDYVFPNYDFVSKIKGEKILNNSLSLTAFDKFSQPLDTITFSATYTNSNFPDTEINFAKVSSTGVNQYTTTNVQKLKFKFDSENDIITIAIDPNNYVDASVLANALNPKFKAASTYLAGFSEPTAYAENGRLIIRSPITGRDSRVWVYYDDETADAMNALGISKGYYTGSPRSYYLFEDTCEFNYDTRDVLLKMKTNELNRDFSFSNVGYVGQTSGTTEGVTVEKIIYDINEIDTVDIELGSTIEVEAYLVSGTTVTGTFGTLNLTQDELIDKLVFSDIQENEINNGFADQAFVASSIVNNSSELTKYGIIFDSVNPVYNYFTAKMNFQTTLYSDVVGVGSDNEDFYKQFNIENRGYFKIKYKRKLYNFIIAEYQANPYQPVGEAKALLDNYKGTDRNIICMEHLIKPVQFLPLGVGVTCKLRKGFDPTSTKADIIQLVRDNFGYKNSNTENDIGQGASLNRLASLVALQDGVYDVKVYFVKSDGSAVYTDLFDTSTEKNQYYFVLDEAMFLKLQAYEDTVAEIAGISDRYAITVTVTQVLK